MSEPRLFISSGRARELALQLARLENKSVDDVVERALEAYRVQREPAAVFYARLAADYGSDDIDLDAVIRDGRRPHSPPEF